MRATVPDIVYHPNCDFLQKNPHLFVDVYNSSNWQDEYIKIFGKTVKYPRKVAWYGDEGINYTYSGNTHQTAPWYPLLAHIKHEVEHIAQHAFNFALLNYYHDGYDYMGWHCDNEKSLGQRPLIASISLGASRVMKFKHKRLKFHYSLVLEDRSLLIMKGNTQDEWLHAIPKQPKTNDARINITFRYILRA